MNISEIISRIRRGEDSVTQFKRQDFVSTSGCADGQDFITAYMRGETRARIDNAAAVLSNMTAEELCDEFAAHDGYTIRPGKAIDPFAADWIGQFYAYYQWQTGERSRDIVSRFPTQVMCAAYPGLHDLDLSLAAERMAGQVLH